MAAAGNAAARVWAPRSSVRRNRFPRPLRPRLGVFGWWLLLAAWCGCSGDSAPFALRWEYTLHGFLRVGEADDQSRERIRIVRVGPIDEFYDPNANAVDDALVLLWKDGAAAPETLRRTGRGSYELPPGVVIEPRTTYQLTAAIPDGPTLSATTTTPSLFVAHGGPPVVPESVPHEVLPGTYPIDVECEDPRQIFVCDLYCLESWQDARYINPFGNHDRPEDFEEYGGDQGEPRHIFAYFRIQDVIRGPDDRYRIDFYNAMIAFYGLNDLNIMAIDENTYNWLYRDHPEENGGVHGGIGVFGSVCRRRWALRVVE